MIQQIAKFAIDDDDLYEVIAGQRVEKVIGAREAVIATILGAGVA